MYTLIDNYQIYFQKTGKGKDLIMLHGWGLDVSTFWPAVDFLKEDFTIWLIDLPGFGRSDFPKKPFNTQDYAEVIFQFIEKNNIKKPVLLGHSFGGKVAIKLASLYPNLLDKLILNGSSGIKLDYSLKRSIIFPLAKIAHFILPDWFHLKSIIRKNFYRKIESDYLDSGLMRETFLKSLKADLTSDLSKIKTETLVLWGEKDRAVPLKYGKRMYQLIKNSKLIVIEGRGHFLHLKDPERFAYFIKDFSL